MRKTLNKKKAKRILKFLGLKKGKVDTIEVGNFSLYIVDDFPAVLERSGRLFHTISYFLRNGTEKYVEVDDGAVKYILNGADVMRPGIIDFSEFSEGDEVVILNKNKILGVGIALCPSERLREMKKGKVVKTLYTIKDEIFRIEKNFL